MFFGQNQECWDAFVLVWITVGAAHAFPAETQQGRNLSFGLRRSDAHKVLWLIFTLRRGMIQRSNVRRRQSELIRLQSAQVSQQQTVHGQVKRVGGLRGPEAAEKHE